MRHASALRSIALSAATALLLACAFAAPTHAQSELMRSDRMPYDAFDRMPKTDLDVPSGVIHVAFGAGEFALPKAKILEWVAASAQAVLSTHSPISLMRPISSASGMKRAGLTGPWSGWSHLINASNPVIASLEASTLG